MHHSIKYPIDIKANPRVHTWPAHLTAVLRTKRYNTDHMISPTVHKHQRSATVAVARVKTRETARTQLPSLIQVALHVRLRTGIERDPRYIDHLQSVRVYRRTSRADCRFTPSNRLKPLADEATIAEPHVSWQTNRLHQIAHLDWRAQFDQSDVVRIVAGCRIVVHVPNRLFDICIDRWFSASPLVIAVVKGGNVVLAQANRCTVCVSNAKNTIYTFTNFFPTFRTSNTCILIILKCCALFPMILKKNVVGIISPLPQCEKD